MCDQLSVRMIAGNESDSVAFGISSVAYPGLILCHSVYLILS